MNPRMDLALAIDIGGTKFAAGLVTRSGDLLDREIHRIDHRDNADELFDELARLVKTQMQKAAERHDGRVGLEGRRRAPGQGAGLLPDKPYLRG